MSWLRKMRISFRAIVILALVLSGCASSFEYGAHPRISVLSQLTPSDSTRADVLLTLGEPRGYGAVRIDPRPETKRIIWFYEFTKLDGKEVDLEILLVFFDKDFYDGHMWFESTNLLKIEEVN